MRIDLLLESRSSLTYEHHAAQHIVKEFEKRQIPYKKIMLSDGILQDYMQYVRDHPPHQMVSFTALLPFEPPFCDVVHVPQLMWAQNSLSEAAHFLVSKFGTIGLPSPTTLPQTVYLPHGVKRLTPQAPLFDVVFFSPLVDLACLRERWNEFFPKEVITLIEKGIQQRLADVSAFPLLQERNHSFSLCHAFEAIEEYIRAERAQHVIFSCEQYTLDVFGEHIGNNWYRRLPNPTCVHLHAPLPFTAYFEVLSQSKIVILDPLDSSWTLHAAAAGCLPLRADKEELQQHIALLLADSKKREKELESYQEHIEAHSWDNQVSRLIENIYES